MDKDGLVSLLSRKGGNPMHKQNRVVPENVKVLLFEEARNYLALGKERMFQLTRDGEIKHYRIGKRKYYRVSDLDEFIANQFTK
jgi:excisionase family DNA binding protein